MSAMRPNRVVTPGRNYKNGRAAEYAARDVLLAEGYTVMRAAGSKGAADLVGVKADGAVTFTRGLFRPMLDVIFVSVKRGTGRADQAQRERLRALPNGTRVEIWTRVRGGFEREVVK